jgi:hypothetical protein
VQSTAPGQPAQPGGASQFGDTVARDLVNALIDLLNVQNDFLSVWVDQEVQRLQLDFDLGVMELDPNGLRIEHSVPLRSFLENLPPTAPWEIPDACAARETVTGEALPSGESLPLQPDGPELGPPVDRSSGVLWLPEISAANLPLAGDRLTPSAGDPAQPAGAPPADSSAFPLTDGAAVSALPGTEPMNAPPALRRLPSLTPPIR